MNKSSVNNSQVQQKEQEDSFGLLKYIGFR